MRNTIAKIENSYSGGDFVIVGGDLTVLSVFAAAACKCELTEHAQFTLRPGGFFELPELVREYAAGTFRHACPARPAVKVRVRLRVRLRVSLHRAHSSIYQSIYLSIHPSIHPSICIGR